MIHNTKARMFREYLDAIGKSNTVTIDESDTSNVKFIFGYKIFEWYSNVVIDIPDGEILKVNIILRDYKVNRYLEPVYETLNRLNAQTQIMNFHLDSGSVIVSFPYFVKNNNLFFPSLLMDVLNMMLDYIGNYAYGVINSTIALSERISSQIEDKESDIDGREYDSEEYDSPDTAYDKLLERYGYDEDAMKTDPDYWDLIQ